MRERPGLTHLGFAAWLAMASASGAQSPAVAISAQRVIDGTGQVLQNATVVVEHGRVVSVGPRPAGFRGAVYELGNATVMPGLIDVHSHVAWHFNAEGRLHTSDDGE